VTGFVSASVCTGALVLATSHQRAAYRTTREVYPADYQGLVWITAKNPSTKAATVVIRWGPDAQQLILQPSTQVVYQVAKGHLAGRDDQPMIVEFTRSVQLKFAFDDPPPGKPIDIDALWRSTGDVPHAG
jgi:hypothetical protein